MILPECYGCAEPLVPDQRVWLRENGDHECDECHDERLRCDPFDHDDYGHPYYVSILTNEVDSATVVRYIPITNAS